MNETDYVTTRKIFMFTYFRNLPLIVRWFAILLSLAPIRVIHKRSSDTHALSQSQIVGNSFSKYSIEAHSTRLATIYGKSTSDMILAHNIVKLHKPKVEDANM